MAEEEEVKMEVEAAQAVYGDDCIVLNSFPPHLRIHIKPRTADVYSQQFVEATIELRAGPQYPSDAPYVDIIGSKGLYENRQKHLSTSLHDKACELASCLMLVALCEEAVETLSSMNHPEGDCPLCLYPLVSEEGSKSKPFMKLMSCFHCFHCDCIIRWLEWIQKQNDDNSGTSNILSTPVEKENMQASDICSMMGGNTGNCPVCRKVFLAKDIEHVLNSVDSHGVDSDDEKELCEKVLQCDLEISRRQKFEAALELQQERGGLIEPPKDNVLFSRISILDLIREATMEPNGEASEQQNGDRLVSEESQSQPSGFSNQTRGTTRQRQRGKGISTGPTSSGTQARSHAGQHRHSAMRRQGRNDSRPQLSSGPGKTDVFNHGFGFEKRVVEANFFFF